MGTDDKKLTAVSACDAIKVMAAALASIAGSSDIKKARIIAKQAMAIVLALPKE